MSITWIIAAGLTAAMAAPALAAQTADAALITAPTMVVGDTWVLDDVTTRGETGFSEQKINLRVQQLRDDVMVIGIKRDGAPGDYQDHISGQDWSHRRVIDGQEVVTTRPLNFPLSIGKTWTAEFDDKMRHGLQTSAHSRLVYKVLGWEDVATPAGSFHAMRIEVNGVDKLEIAPAIGAATASVVSPGDIANMTHAQASAAHTEFRRTYEVIDYVPAVKTWVKSAYEQYNGDDIRIGKQERTLISFTPGQQASGSTK